MQLVINEIVLSITVGMLLTDIGISDHDGEILMLTALVLGSNENHF